MKKILDCGDERHSSNTFDTFDTLDTFEYLSLLVRSHAHAYSGAYTIRVLY